MHAGVIDKICELGPGLLGSEAVRGLREVLRPGRLIELVETAGGTGSGRSGWSRPTIWRALRARKSRLTDPRDRLVEAVAERLCDPVAMKVTSNVVRGLARYESEGRADPSPEVFFREALKANFQDAFKGSGFIGGLVLHGAAASASDVLDRPEQGDADDHALARRLLILRRDFYRQMTQQFVAILNFAMTQSGRRPRSEFNDESITIAVHSLHDGLVMRRLLDPDAVSDDLAADLLMALAMALTEIGGLDDPRAPKDPEQRRRYDKIIGATIQAFGEERAPGDDVILLRSGEATDVLRYLFPTRGDLVDSALRSLLGAVAESLNSIGGIYPNPFITMMLGWMLRVARQHPNLMVAALRTRIPEESGLLLNQVVDTAAAAIASSTGLAPMETANDLINLAATGNVYGLNALLRAAGLTEVDAVNEEGPPRP